MRTTVMIQITPAVAGWHAVFLGRDDAIRLDPIVCWALVEVTEEWGTYRSVDGMHTYTGSDGSSSIQRCDPTFAFDSGFLAYAPPGKTAADYKANAEAAAAARAESETPAPVEDAMTQPG